MLATSSFMFSAEWIEPVEREGTFIRKRSADRSSFASNRWSTRRGYRLLRLVLLRVKYRCLDRRRFVRFSSFIILWNWIVIIKWLCCSFIFVELRIDSGHCRIKGRWLKNLHTTDWRRWWTIDETRVEWSGWWKKSSAMCNTKERHWFRNAGSDQPIAVLVRILVTFSLSNMFFYLYCCLWGQVRENIQPVAQVYHAWQGWLPIVRRGK